MSDYYDIHTGEPVTDEDAHTMFDEYLDEVLDEVSIGTLTYTASDVLKSVDPVAYRCEFSDWSSEYLAESGYFVRVLTVDGEVHEGPDWYADEDDARTAYDNTVEELTDDDAEDVHGLTVQLFDTSDDVLAESHIVAELFGRAVSPRVAIVGM